MPQRAVLILSLQVEDHLAAAAEGSHPSEIHTRAGGLFRHDDGGKLSARTAFTVHQANARDSVGIGNPRSHGHQLSLRGRDRLMEDPADDGPQVGVARGLSQMTPRAVLAARSSEGKGHRHAQLAAQGVSREVRRRAWASAPGAGGKIRVTYQEAGAAKPASPDRDPVGSVDQAGR